MTFESMLRGLARAGAVLGAVLAAHGPAASALAVEPTSCDVKTGASCAWNEGCDCDHDGYVVNKSKATKYCHIDKCPLDSDDKNVNKLGVVSANNADGDGWTKAYDCDDNDKCIGKACGVSTCTTAPPDPDNDKDGVPASQDCNDADANIKPGSGIACCNCANLTDPAKVKALGCTGCPLSQTGPADAGSTDTTGPDAGSSPMDISAPDVAAVDSAVPPADTAAEDAATDGGQTGAETGADGANSVAKDAGPALTDSGSSFDPSAQVFVGSGTVVHGDPPAPGCSAAPQASPAILPLFAGLLLAFGARRWRVRRALWALGLLAMATTGCVRVEPWQRQRLAHRCMVLGRNGGEKDLEQHAFQYREGSAGGFGGGGGGCGCN